MTIFLVILLASLNGVYSTKCTSVDSKYDCGYAGITQDQCESSGCCYVPAGENSATPWCFRASNTYHLGLVERTKTGIRGKLELASDTATSTYGSKLEFPLYGDYL